MGEVDGGALMSVEAVDAAGDQGGAHAVVEAGGQVGVPRRCRVDHLVEGDVAPDAPVFPPPLQHRRQAALAAPGCSLAL